MKQKNVILMVVAVGCGLVAAFLTSQMSAKGQVEQVDVVVAAKDLPVGTTITREDVDKFVKIKKVPKDGLPPAYVIDKEVLVDKRLSRPVRAEETFNPQDLLKGGAITLPAGYHMVSLPVGVGQAAAGFVGPGSRVDVLCTVRTSERISAFPLLINMLVVAVDTQTTYDKNGVFPTLNMVSFAVKEKEALLLSLAKTRGCTLELMLRHPDSNHEENNDKRIDEMLKLLSEERTLAKIAGNANAEVAPVKNEGKPEAKPDTKVELSPSPAAPRLSTSKVLVAKQDIAPNTAVTNDLIQEAFEWKDVPKEFTADAVTDTQVGDALGKAFKTGVSKGQWVTKSMVGLQAPKSTPQDTFVPEKPGEAVPPTPVKPLVVVKRKTLDVTVHTPTGSSVHRYEEVEPGKWKKIAELTLAQAAEGHETPKPEAAPEGKSETPKTTPEEKKRD